MELAMIGLGRMGANIVRRIMRDGHSAVVNDVSADAVEALKADGATGSADLAEMIGMMSTPRNVWIMGSRPASIFLRRYEMYSSTMFACPPKS